MALLRAGSLNGEGASPEHLTGVLKRASVPSRSELFHQCQRYYGNHYVQRVVGAIEEDRLRRDRAGTPRESEKMEAGVSEAVIPSGNGSPLPPEHRMAFERALNHPLDHVRIHTGTYEDHAARRINAEAFTVGSDIYFAGGSYLPGTDRGDRVLGHELTHVVQHDHGRVPRVTAREKGISSPTDQLEKEAYRQEDALVEHVRVARRQGPAPISADRIGARYADLPVLRRANAVIADDADGGAPRRAQDQSREPGGSSASKPSAAATPPTVSKPKPSETPISPVPRTGGQPVGPAEAPGAREAPAAGKVGATAARGAEPARDQTQEARGAPSLVAPSAAPSEPGAVKAKSAAGKATGGMAVAPAPPSPRQAIAPAIGAVRQRAAGARKHSPPGAPVASAQAAAIDPKKEQTRTAAQHTVEKLSAAEAEKVRRQEFKKKLKDAITAATSPPPTTQSKAENMMETGGTTASTQMRGQLAVERDAAAGPMGKAAASEVPASAIEPKPKADLQPEPVGSPPSPVSAAPVVPAPLPAERLDYSSDRAPADQAMAESGVSKAQLEKGNEPEFGKTLEARSTAEKHEATAEPRYRQSESKVQAEAHNAAQSELTEKLAGMHGARAMHINKVIGQQVGTKTKDASERQVVTDTINKIKNDTKAKVASIMEPMEKEAAKIFEDGLSDAENEYKATFEKAKGGLGTWLTTWGSDWERLIEESLATARSAYLEKVDVAIDKVANYVDDKLTAAKQCVADGRKEVDTYVKGLDQNLKQFGEEAREKVSGDFDAMESEIDQRRDALIDKLAEQYKASYERMSAMEEKLREENKSLWQRVYDATVGVIKKILAFKDMLLSILAKAASVIEDIISDPIGFLGNLVSGVMLGLKNFMGKIAGYLKKGLMEWLFGALAGAGLQLPETFDLKGILSIVLQLLGMTYTYFRSRAVKLIGEPVVAALEKAADVFRVFATEGVSGLWQFIKEKVTDLKSMVLDAIFDFIKDRVIIAGVTWIIGLLNPASAFFKACKAIYDIVMFFITRGSQIMTLVNAVINSISAIAKGSLGAAATWIEEALAKAIPVAIGFLAGLLGLGDITGTIRKTIEKAQAPVNKAIDWVIHQAMRLVKAAGKLISDVFGKKGGTDTTSPTEDPSIGVRMRAQQALAERLKGEHTKEAAAQIVHGIETEHRKFGLKSLELGPETEDGTTPILAEASAKRPLANLTRGVPKPKGRSVTSKVQVELSAPIEVPATMLETVDPKKAGVPIGGVVWTPSTRASRKVNVVTWNTSDIDPPGNSSHAEHQFVSYMESREELWPLVEKIVIVNVSRSPCSVCAPELASLLKRVKVARKGQPVSAQIFWTQLHSTGAQPTTWEGLHEMQSAGWGLSAPGTALPPEKGYHADMVQVKLI